MANYILPSNHILVKGELVKTEDAGPRLKIEHKGTIYEAPPFKVLQSRVDNYEAGNSSIYEALDGCLLKFAHTECEHGCPSWLWVGTAFNHVLIDGELVLTTTNRGHTDG